jgi:hypothetical protein
MARMVRKQICIDDDIDRALAEKARTLGVSQGEVVRGALRRDLEGAGDPALETAYLWIDHILEARAAEGPLPGSRTWTRDEAHDDDSGAARGTRHAGSARH